MQRLNYTLSGHYELHGQTRMALKTAGFLAAIERGAHFIFQANPGRQIIFMAWQQKLKKNEDDINNNFS